nr:uncharacterized protein LOC105867896 [Microcebus murinus]
MCLRLGAPRKLTGSVRGSARDGRDGAWGPAKARRQDVLPGVPTPGSFVFVSRFLCFPPHFGTSQSPEAAHGAVARRSTCPGPRGSTCPGPRGSTCSRWEGGGAPPRGPGTRPGHGQQASRANRPQAPSTLHTAHSTRHLQEAGADRPQALSTLHTLPGISRQPRPTDPKPCLHCTLYLASPGSPGRQTPSPLPCTPHTLPGISSHWSQWIQAPSTPNTARSTQHLQAAGSNGSNQALSTPHTTRFTRHRLGHRVRKSVIPASLGSPHGWLLGPWDGRRGRPDAPTQARQGRPGLSPGGRSRFPGSWSSSKASEGDENLRHRLAGTARLRWGPGRAAGLEGPEIRLEAGLPWGRAGGSRGLEEKEFPACSFSLRQSLTLSPRLE